jgi:hypothetical protein
MLREHVQTDPVERDESPDGCSFGRFTQLLAVQESERS